MIDVKIRKVHPDAVIPQYATDGSAGMDVTAISMSVTDKYIEYDTGLAFEIPEGYVMLVFPRSSISKYDLVLANSVPVIDSDYRGTVKLRFKPTGIGLGKVYAVGDRIGQVMIVPYPKIEFNETEELSETKRGSGGFGSTNK